MGLPRYKPLIKQLIVPVLTVVTGLQFTGYLNYSDVFGGFLFYKFL